VRSTLLRKRRKFSAEFQVEQVLAILTGSKTAAEICRAYDLKPPLLSDWESEFLAKAPPLFQSEAQRSQESVHIAEWERLVGRLTLQLAIARICRIQKASTLSCRIDDFVLIKTANENMRTEQKWKTVVTFCFLSNNSASF
jgi:transposase-like protein